MIQKNSKVLTADDIKAIQEHRTRYDLEKQEKEREKRELALARESERQIAKEEKKKRIPLASDENNTATTSEMAHLIKDKRKWYALGKEMGKPKDDVEFSQRVNQFWDMIGQSGENPHKADLCNFLDIDNATYSNWSRGQGCSRERAEIVAGINNMFLAVVDSLALDGKIAQIPYIWQSKQWFGYKEPKQEIDVTNHNPMSQFPDALSVEAKYQDLLVGDTEVDPKYLENVEVENGEE